MNSADDKSKMKSCNVCGKLCKESGNLKKHLLTHTGDRPFQCEICAKSFSQKETLKRHNRIHTGEKPYACSKCGKSFSQRGYLKVHDRTHTGEKPYTCKICGKSFSLMGHMKGHNQIHTGEKSYMCDKCGKSFLRRNDLKVHIRTHTGEKPYTCKICGKSFSLSGGLKAHNRMHTGEKPYTCNKCGKSFSDGRNLKIHNCNVCGTYRPILPYIQLPVFKIHNRKHTDEKPYTCNKCGKSFSSMSSLKSHNGTDRLGKYQCGTYRPILPNLFKIHNHLHTDENPYADDSSGKSCAEMENSGKLDDACNSEESNVGDVSVQSENSLNELHSHTDNKLSNSFLSKGYFSDEVQKHVREVQEYIEEEANHFNNSLKVKGKKE